MAVDDVLARLIISFNCAIDVIFAPLVESKMVHLKVPIHLDICAAGVDS